MKKKATKNLKCRKVRKSEKDETLIKLRSSLDWEDDWSASDNKRKEKV
jgi:hypothetical protein